MWTVRPSGNTRTSCSRVMRGHMPHVAGVHVHERRAGGRIEADAAALQPQADDAQVFERHAGNVEIHGVAEHVLAEARHAVAAAPQHGVGFRRAIAAHHPDRLFDPVSRCTSQIRSIRCGSMSVSCCLPPIAQEPVELLQRGLVVTAVALEGDGDVFVGVDVMQRDRAGVAFGDRVLQRARRRRADQHSGKTARIGGALDDNRTAFQPRLTKGTGVPALTHYPAARRNSPRGRTTLT